MPSVCRSSIVVKHAMDTLSVKHATRMNTEHTGIMIAGETVEFACDEDTTMKPTFTCLQDGTFDATDQVTCPIPPCYTVKAQNFERCSPTLRINERDECERAVAEMGYGTPPWGPDAQGFLAEDLMTFPSAV